MKNILILFSFYVLISCAGSMTTLPPSELKYQQVVHVQKTKAEIFNLANLWIAKTFKSAKKVVEYSNLDQGVIIGNGSMDVTYTFMPISTSFRLTIDVKDNKARMTFDNMVIGEFGPKEESVLYTKMQMDAFSEQALLLVFNFEDFLNQNNEDW